MKNFTLNFQPYPLILLHGGISLVNLKNYTILELPLVCGCGMRMNYLERNFFFRIQ